MQALCLTVSRLCAAAWCGAGVLFVLLVVDLRGSPLFDAATKLNHPRVLFPAYYKLEFAVLSMAVLLGAPGSGHPDLRGWRRFVYLGLLVAAWLIAIGDFTYVYQPLLAMLEQPALPEGFRQLHTLSRWTNTAVLACCLMASLVSLWPARSEPAVIEARAGG